MEPAVLGPRVRGGAGQPRWRTPQHRYLREHLRRIRLRPPNRHHLPDSDEAAERMRAWFSWPGYGWAREPLSDVWLVRSAALLLATRKAHRRKDLIHEIVRDEFVEEVAHRVDEGHLWLTPGISLGKCVEPDQLDGANLEERGDCRCRSITDLARREWRDTSDCQPTLRA